MVDRRGIETHRSIDQGMLIDRADRWLSLEKAVGGLEFGVFAMSSGSRRGVVGNIGVYVCKAEGEL